jgi:hypothetical protein
MTLRSLGYKLQVMAKNEPSSQAKINPTTPEPAAVEFDSKSTSNSPPSRRSPNNTKGNGSGDYDGPLNEALEEHNRIKR